MDFRTHGSQDSEFTEFRIHRIQNPRTHKPQEFIELREPARSPVDAELLTSQRSEPFRILRTQNLHIHRTQNPRKIQSPLNSEPTEFRKFTEPRIRASIELRIPRILGLRTPCIHRSCSPIEFRKSTEPETRASIAPRTRRTQNLTEPRTRSPVKTHKIHRTPNL